MAYFPDCIQPQYLLIGAVNIKDLKQPAQVQAYLADGNALYANQEHMYIALSTQQYLSADEVPADSIVLSWTDTETYIYRFNLDELKIVCTGQGKIDGRILNQFSMDEYEEFFRIAVTTGSIWGNGEDSKNHLYILDEELNLAGAVTDIAPGEKIYSVRFIGGRAYIVTFCQVDPFFVLDVSNPENPVILEKLKIPGYSEYLHPYDENHILGFGKETIQISYGSDRYGRPGEDVRSYDLGMKVALFDVTDVSNPVELSKAAIGDRGTYSAILEDHKALLFDRSKNLLAFPITVMSLGGKPVLDERNGFKYPNYGGFSYQGAYIYQVDVEKGLQMRGRITHLNEDDYMKAGSSWYNDGSCDIQRILYMEDQLYTISHDWIQAHQIDSLQQTGILHCTGEDEYKQ